MGQICELREFLRSLAFPEKWIDETQKKLSSRAYADSCAAKIMDHMREQIDKAEKFEEMAETVAHDMLAKKYLDLACDNRERILDIIKALDNGSWEQLFDVTRFDSLGRLTKPPMKGLDPEAAANEEHLYEQFSLLFNGLKAPITAIKKEVDPVGRDIYEPMQSSALIFSALIEAVRLLEKNAAEMKLPDHLSKQEIEIKVRETLRLFKLDNRDNALIKALSGGERKRVSVAMEYIADPQVFFLDEPDSGIDGAYSIELMHIMRQIADTGKIVVIVSHSPNRIADNFNKVLVLAKSQLLSSGK